MASGPPTDWFDELDLDPESHPVAMRTRSLGDRPWLIADERRDAELAIKAGLIAEMPAAVRWLTEASRPAAGQVAELVGADPNSRDHPLVAAALAVQEDLALLERRDERWHLDASCVCFPTRWKLAEKVDRPIGEVHAPVGGYTDRIATKVTRLFDRLGPTPVWRRNWFLMTDPTLHQPDSPPDELIVDADRVLTDLFVRSERQTLRQVAQGWLLFTIRIQQQPLGDLLIDPDRTRAFAGWVQDVSPDFGRRRHLTGPQRRPILTALAQRG